MPLTLDEEAAFRLLTEEAVAGRSKLNSWEQGFLDDQVKRYGEHQSKIFMSPKQWAMLRKIHEKATEA